MGLRLDRWGECEVGVAVGVALLEAVIDGVDCAQGVAAVAGARGPLAQQADVRRDRDGGEHEAGLDHADDEDPAALQVRGLRALVIAERALDVGAAAVGIDPGVRSPGQRLADLRRDGTGDGDGPLAAAAQEVALPVPVGLRAGVGLPVDLRRVPRRAGRLDGQLGDGVRPGDDRGAGGQVLGERAVAADHLPRLRGALVALLPEFVG